MWKLIKPPLLLLDKSANWVITTTRYVVTFGQIGKPFDFGTISARWGRERKWNEAAQAGCPVLDKIDPTTDDHCGDAAKHD